MAFTQATGGASTPGATCCGGVDRSATWSSWGVGYTDAWSVGQLHVAVLATDNQGATDGATSDHTSITCNSNTFTKIQEWTYSGGGAANGVTISIWYCVLTNGINGHTCTVALAGSAPGNGAKGLRIMALNRNTGQTLSVDSTVTVTSGTNNPVGSLSTSGLTSKEHLHFRAYGIETSSAIASTPSTNFTNLAAYGTSSGSSATNVSARAEYRINTSTGETSAPSAPAGDGTAILVAFSESSTATPVTLTASSAITPANVIQGKLVKSPSSATSVALVRACKAVRSVTEPQTTAVGKRPSETKSAVASESAAKLVTTGRILGTASLTELATAASMRVKLLSLFAGGYSDGFSGSLDPSWTVIDYGSGGSATIVSGTLEIATVGGGDFWAGTDTGVAVLRPSNLTQDRWLEADVVSSTGFGTTTRMAMWRASTAANSAFVAVLCDSDGSHLTLVWRDAAGVGASWAGDDSGAARPSAPFRIRLELSNDGKTVTAKVYNSGWQTIGSHTTTDPLQIAGLVKGGPGNSMTAFDNYAESAGGQALLPLVAKAVSATRSTSTAEAVALVKSLVRSMPVVLTITASIVKRLIRTVFAGGTLYRNLVKNPAIETNTNFWDSGELYAVAARSQSGATFAQGSNSLQATFSGSTAGEGIGTLFAMQSGKYYRGAIWVRGAVGGEANLTFELGSREAPYDSTIFTGVALTGLTTSFQRYTLAIGPVPFDVPGGYMDIRANPGTAGVIYIDKASIYEVPDLVTDPAYLDGSMPGNIWEGTAHASISSTAPTAVGSGLTLTSNTTRQARSIRAASIGPIGYKISSTIRFLATATAEAPTLTRANGRALIVAVSEAPSVRRAISTTKLALITLVPSSVTSLVTRRTLSAALSEAASKLGNIFRAVSAVEPEVATNSKSIGRSLSVSLTELTTIRRVPARVISAPASCGAAIVRSCLVVRSAAIPISASISRAVPKALTAASAQVGANTKLGQKLLVVSLSEAPSIRRAVVATKLATTSGAAALRRAVSAAKTAVLVQVSQFITGAFSPYLLFPLKVWVQELSLSVKVKEATLISKVKEAGLRIIGKEPTLSAEAKESTLSAEVDESGAMIVDVNEEGSDNGS